MTTATAHWWGRGREKTGAVVAGDGAEFIKQEGTSHGGRRWSISRELATSVNRGGSAGLVDAVTFPGFLASFPISIAPVMSRRKLKPTPTIGRPNRQLLGGGCRR